MGLAARAVATGLMPNRRIDTCRVPPLLTAGPLAALTALMLWSGAPRSAALDLSGAAPYDREAASFARCGMGSRAACVIDGDTFWYRGEKIRVADINTPEASEPRCAAEAALAEHATARLMALLNAGAFSLEAADRSHDRYGRRLAVVTRGGESLGDALIAEGLAEQWRGHRREWCRAPGSHEGDTS